MSDPVPDNIPWYKSNIYRGLLITLLTQVLSAFKVTSALTPEAAPIADALLEIVSAAGVAWAAYSRAKHPLPNVTTTQKQADALNQKPPETP
jgi:hypothetical protein